MAKKKKVTLVNPIDVEKLNQELKLVDPKVFKDKKINKYKVKNLTLVEKVKNFFKKFIMR